MKRRYVIEVQRDPQNPLHKESITCTKLDAVGMSLDLMRKKEFQIPGVTVGFFEEGKENLGYVFFMHRFCSLDTVGGYWE